MKKIYTFLFLFFFLNITAQVTTSGITGNITDVKGESIIGATVMVVHNPTGYKYGGVTNFDGFYSLEGLKVGGPYSLTISYIGFQTQVISDIYIKLGSYYEKDIILKDMSQALSEVVVSAGKGMIFNSNITGAAQDFNAEKISQVASISRSVYDVAKNSPLAMVKEGGLSIAGSNVRYNSFQIDGLVNNDVFGLSGSGTNGGQASANPISLDAIDEIQLVVAPFDVRQSGFSGGGINAVTKAGTNNFHGSAYGYYNDENFYGKTPGTKGEDYFNEREQVDDISTKTYGFTLGGPIVKNKLFFFVNYEKVDNTTPSNAVPGTDLSNVKLEDVKSVMEHLETLTAGVGVYDGGGYGVVNNDTKNDKFLARLDWNINDNNKLMLRYSYVDASKFFYDTSFNLYKLTDAGYTFNSRTSNVVVELNTKINNSLSNEFRVGWTRVRDSDEPNGRAFPNFKINNLQTVSGYGSASIEFGTDRYAAATQVDQDIYTIEDNVVWNYGKHKFVFGTHNEFFKFSNLFIANNYGSYEYSSLNDFVTGALPNSYNYGYSNEMVTGTDKWVAELGAGQFGLYFQDEWRAFKNFKLTYGLRADVPVFFDRPSANSDFNNTKTAKSMGLATDNTPDLNVLWSPRIGFRLYTDDTHNTLVRGGVGVFTGRIPFVWLSNCFSNTGVQNANTYLSSGDMTGAQASGFSVSVDPLNQWKDEAAGIPKSEVDVVSENFKFPQTLRANLAIEQVLPFGVKGTLEGLYSKVYNDIWYKNVKLEKSGVLDNGTLDHRNIYSNVSDLEDYTYVILLDNSSKSYSASLSAKLEKDFNFGLSVMTAYTLSESKTVNAGLSSQAKTNWRYMLTYDGDAKADLSFSPYDVRNRVIVSVAYKKDFGKHFGTEASLFYQGYSGSRFSYLYSYGSDINGDGQYNDLIYVPTDEEISSMSFRDVVDWKTHEVIQGASDNKADFVSWLNSNESFKDFKGDYVKSYSGRLPFEHHFDLHLAENFYMNVAGCNNTLQISLDIMNVGNMLNHDWNCYNVSSSTYGTITPLSFSEGKYVFTDPGRLDRVSDIDSRWHAQVGFKYIF